MSWGVLDASKRLEGNADTVVSVQVQSKQGKKGWGGGNGGRWLVGRRTARRGMQGGFKGPFKKKALNLAVTSE